MIHRIDILSIPNNRVYETVGEPSGSELDMINVLSAADITFIMSSSQAIVN